MNRRLRSAWSYLHECRSRSAPGGNPQEKGPPAAIIRNYAHSAKMRCEGTAAERAIAAHLAGLATAPLLLPLALPAHHCAESSPSAARPLIAVRPGVLQRGAALGAPVRRQDAAPRQPVRLRRPRILGARPELRADRQALQPCRGKAQSQCVESAVSDAQPSTTVVILGGKVVPAYGTSVWHKCVYRLPSLCVHMGFGSFLLRTAVLQHHYGAASNASQTTSS